MAMATSSTLPADTLSPSLREGLLEYFPSSLLSPDSAPLLAEVLSLLRIYNLTPSDLADKWESFCLNKKHLLAEVDDGDPFQLENVRELKKHIQEGLERESRNKRSSLGTPIARGGKMGMADDIFAAISPQTPSVKRKVSTPVVSTPVSKSRLSDISNMTPLVSSPLAGKSTTYPLIQRDMVDSRDTPFAQRRQPGALLQTLNQQTPLPELHSIAEVGRIPFSVNVDMKKFGFRTMHQSLMAASEVLDDRIDSMAEILQEQYSIPAEDFTNPARASPNEIVAVGRICLDPPTTAARPTATSLTLETSRRLGAGSRISLNLSSVPSFSLFPGQVIGVRGVNASGDYLAVKEILLPQRLPCPDVLPSEVLMRGVRMVVASGPWGTDKGGWEGFEEICRIARDESVDVLIIMGPFLDESHPGIQKGTVSITSGPPTMESLFKQEISSRLRTLNPETQIILIPHIRDICSPHAVWPQDPLPRLALDLPKNVRCLTNPTVFSLGEATVGVNTNDILRGISLEECTKNPVNQGLYDRLPNYIMQQRHFYPLFPGRSESRVAIQESGLGEFVGGTPDILILPSELQYFAKVVDGVVILNPGPVSKKASAGTFARVYVAPKEGVNGGMEVDGMKADVWERCRVDLHRI